MSASRIVLLLLVVLAIFQYTRYEPLLPTRVASHFDAAGQPNGWSSKSAYMVGNLAFAGGFALLFLGLTGLVRRIPNDWINMPNRDYWLAPERRTATLAQLQRQMEWLGAATVALLLAIGQLTIEANLTAAPLDQRAFWIVFGAYMAGALVWLVSVLRWAFKKPKGGPATSERPDATRQRQG